MSIKNMIEAEMALKGISKAELSDATGISKASLYRKINGISFFNSDEIVKIANVLRLPTDRIVEIFFANEVSKY